MKYQVLFTSNDKIPQIKMSDATLCGVGSGSELLVYDPFMGFQVRMVLKKQLVPLGANCTARQCSPLRRKSME